MGSNPGLQYNQVPTAAQWNSYFAAKQDDLGFTPLNQAGGTMTGKLTVAPSTTGAAGINIVSGVTPTSPMDGDMWYDGTNLKFQVGGITKTITWS